MAIQPTTYDAHNNESLAEHFLVKNSAGAVGYIGCTSVVEHGAWLSNTKGLSPYFFEDYNNGTRTLGEVWKNALTEFINDLYHPTTGGMFYYSFLHIHKMILFGDPSLAVGGLERVRHTPSTPTIIPEINWLFEIISENHPEEAEELKALYDIGINTSNSQEIIELYNEWCPVLIEVMENEEVFKEIVNIMLYEVLMLIEESEG